MKTKRKIDLQPVEFLEYNTGFDKKIFETLPITQTHPAGFDERKLIIAYGPDANPPWIGLMIKIPNKSNIAIAFHPTQAILVGQSMIDAAKKAEGK